MEKHQKKKGKKSATGKFEDKVRSEREYKDRVVNPDEDPASDMNPEFFDENELDQEPDPEKDQKEF
jgi:hypothetical protein